MWRRSSRIIQHVEDSLSKVAVGKTKLPERAFEMYGLSGPKTRMFYNAICDTNEETNYLEVGAFQGSSTASSCYGNPFLAAYVVENWSEFSGSYEIFEKNSGWAYDWKRMNLFQHNFRAVDIEFLPEINIYLYDGAHEKQDHKEAITHFAGALSKYSIILIDDWNWECVREGTEEGIAESGLKVLYRREIFTEYEAGERDWWNGIGIFVLESNLKGGDE